jgi:uncharacterized Rmd1/YagE family protein
MRCTGYCTSTNYNLKPLLAYFKNRHTTTLYRDVVHVDLSADGQIRDAYFFSYGAAIFWGMSEEQELELLGEVKAFEVRPLELIETDYFTFGIGENAKITQDEIVLPNSDSLSRLAVSHGIAQSVKLGTFEVRIQRTVSSTRFLPEDLSKKGRITLSRKEIRKKMGELFIERNSINLHFDVLDTPEFFWEYVELEPLYIMMANYLDVRRRVDILNKRLDVVHELFDMLGTELNHQHSSRLEWTIICLIVIEVALSLMHDIFRWI